MPRIRPLWGAPPDAKVVSTVTIPEGVTLNTAPLLPATTPGVVLYKLPSRPCAMMPGQVGLTAAPPSVPKLPSTAKSGRPKVAVTDRAALRVTLHTPMPEQAPLQPVNVDPAPAMAVSVTVPLANVVEQTGPQLIPIGVLITVPTPVPAVETVSGNVGVALTTAR